VGDERVAYACSQEPAHARDTFACHDALWQTGDLTRAENELERLRGVFGGPDLFLPTSFRAALATGDRTAVVRIFQTMLPGERTLAGLYAATTGVRSDALRAAAVTAPDAPAALPSLFVQPRRRDRRFRRRGGTDRSGRSRNPDSSVAATAILRHIEKYDVDSSGLMHARMLDVRRVNGTTDVEENAQADAPELSGREVSRIVRRRIFRRTGEFLNRIEHLTPRRGTPIFRNWSKATPSRRCTRVGLAGRDREYWHRYPGSPPDRTAVYEATVEIRLPKDLRGSLHAIRFSGNPLRHRGR